MTQLQSLKTHELLQRYKQVQAKIDELDMAAGLILRTSGVGQAPPVYHRKVQEMLDIIEKQLIPLWDELTNKVIPNSRYRSFAQELNWRRPDALPPHYESLEKAYLKYNPGGMSP